MKKRATGSAAKIRSLPAARYCFVTIINVSDRLITYNS